MIYRVLLSQVLPWGSRSSRSARFGNTGIDAPHPAANGALDRWEWRPHWERHLGSATSQIPPHTSVVPSRTMCVLRGCSCGLWVPSDRSCCAASGA